MIESLRVFIQHMSQEEQNQLIIGLCKDDDFIKFIKDNYSLSIQQTLTHDVFKRFKNSELIHGWKRCHVGGRELSMEVSNE